LELERDVSNLDEIEKKDLYIFAQVPDLKKKKRLAPSGS